ncbi:hypothetical protein KVR01_001045 [Diaporthe batatas]|uniref:uncharacterized protein n=1 Tax=Diaporthe batatas TaxID=748121 RepID=UPI001D03E3A2|nr:uncharacterized protein KVR01_001045 [Diaporthe batatas]KAG8170300.1 hypothetical protein KVR01_001045 [Diaporthe batatas]
MPLAPEGHSSDQITQCEDAICRSPPEKPTYPVNSTVGYLSGPRLLAILTGVTLAAFIMLLDMTIIVTAIPRITDDFNSLPDLGWYGSAYTVSSAALQPMTGKLYSHLGIKWTFLAFIAVFEVGSLVCGLASSSPVFIVGRAIAGLGSSGIMNGALTIVAASVPLTRRPAVTGIVLGIAYMGSVAGPLIGGALTEYSTWRWCFYINLPIGGVTCAALLFTAIPDHGQKVSHAGHLLSHLDLPGFFLFAPAVAMILLGLQYGGNRYAWSSPRVIGLLCGGLATGIVFAAWEGWRKEKAMMPLSLLSKRAVWSSVLVGGFMTSTLLVHSYYLPIYFQAVKGASPTMSGVYLLPSILSQLLSSAFFGAIVGKLGYCIPAVLLSGVMVAIGGGLLSLLTVSTPTAKWIGYQVLLGFGRGVGIQMPFIAVQAVLGSHLVPESMSLIVFAQTFGGSIFLTVANVIFNNQLRTLLEQNVPGVPADRVIGAGATAFRSVVPEQDLESVLRVYSRALSAVFYLSAALACVYLGLSWGMGWTDIRKKGVAEEQADMDKGS